MPAVHHADAAGAQVAATQSSLCAYLGTRMGTLLVSMEPFQLECRLTDTLCPRL